jgi:predicted nucleic acid-binding protein
MFLDTSVIIELFQSDSGSPRFVNIYEHVKGEPLFMSVIQVAELSDWCLKNNIRPEDMLGQLKRIVGTIPLNERLCLEGSRIKSQMRAKGSKSFSLMDGLILASARSVNQKLLTLDRDFAKADGVVVLKEK